MGDASFSIPQTPGEACNLTRRPAAVSIHASAQPTGAVGEHWRKTSFSRRNPATGGQARSITTPNRPFHPASTKLAARDEGRPGGRQRFPLEAMNPEGAWRPDRTAQRLTARTILQDPSSLHDVMQTLRTQGPSSPERRKPTLFLLGQPTRTLDTGANGGAERDRTDDLMLAKHALSQLSYSPDPRANRTRPANANQPVVGPGRFELPTSPLSGVRSNQLSYGPEPAMRRAAGIIQGRKRNADGGSAVSTARKRPDRSRRSWYARREPDWRAPCSKTTRYGCVRTEPPEDDAAEGP